MTKKKSNQANKQKALKKETSWTVCLWRISFSGFQMLNTCVVEKFQRKLIKIEDTQNFQLVSYVATLLNFNEVFRKAKLSSSNFFRIKRFCIKRFLQKLSWKFWDESKFTTANNEKKLILAQMRKCLLLWSN